MSEETQDSFTFTVGKLDAGMAILIGERAHLIEFPSLLLPPGVASGSIVDIAVHRNISQEKRHRAEFWDLQRNILSTYGSELPKAPQLAVRNITQTSVTLEWPALELATAKLRALEIHKNGQRLAAIPSPLQNTSTKLSGLSVETAYTFQLILRTTAGNFSSNLVEVKTHSMNDTSGISVCFGNVQDRVLLENAKLALQEMRAKWSDRIQIDTTHFVCTTPEMIPDASGVSRGGVGVEYQKALQLSIPVVQPQWIVACLQEKRMVPISSFYLGATPSAFLSSASFARPKNSSSSTTAVNVPQSPTSPKSPPVPDKQFHGQTQSPPILALSPKRESTSSPKPPPRSPLQSDEPQTSIRSPHQAHRKSGTMDKTFKFPPEVPPPQVTVSPTEEDDEEDAQDLIESTKNMKLNLAGEGEKGPKSVEIPPPTPIAKDTELEPEFSNEEVGETVEVDLT
ncbi:uncharacterized protein EI90DRAFT_2977012 [Cantharellus anzutake]|uniref:uncharacterized protein n=1 Tax=Cantharellus anzutake TaxID=1750568 RepID=UPI0019074421|nr:uncharacterized protein EI90DRAFT_2977012 [Cantharellus anzutake]KAF8324597.1 hypothetical protein EI90DRAFT_2977012 [Cantharellus anzutake]